MWLANWFSVLLIEDVIWGFPPNDDVIGDFPSPL